MVVDDEPLVRLSLRRALEKRGHEVTECDDGTSAAVIWEQVRPELVYLDVLMPNLSGPELLRIVQPEVRSECKVILMSAFSGEYDSKKAQSLGADLFLGKPFADIFTVIETGEKLVRGSTS